MYQEIANRLEQEEPVVLVTLLARKGENSREHARFAVFMDGSTAGTIGGGKKEEQLRAYALQCISQGESSHCTIAKSDYWLDYIGEEYVIPLFRKAARLEKRNNPFVLATIMGQSAKALYGEHFFLYLSPNGLVHEKAMRLSCQSVFEGKGQRIQDNLLLDMNGRRERLILLGGGNVAKETAELAYRLGFPYSLWDQRKEFSTRRRFPHAGILSPAPSLDEALLSFHLDGHSYVVVTEHGEEAIPLILHYPVPYIGVLASRRKASKWDDGRISCPVGLDLGGEDPSSVAFSIMAEVMRTVNRTSGKSFKDEKNLIIVRGAGDLATGVLIRLHNAGYQVMATEVEKPTVIRRTVSFAEAIYEGKSVVEGVTAQMIDDLDEAYPLMDKGIIPVIADAEGKSIMAMRPRVVVDAILAKRNLGTKRSDAPLVIALGPGFTAGKDCHLVIETMRGHDLGRIINEGSARANTGVPGIIAGYGKERVVHSPGEGVFRHCGHEIGDIVQKGETIAMVGDKEVKSQLDGMLRGLLRDGLSVSLGFKVADVDPRGKDAQCTSVSDKAKAIAGGVLEAVDHHFRYLW